MFNIITRYALIRNYKYCPGVEEIFKLILKNKASIKSIKRGSFDTIIVVGDKEIEFWSENRHYAYACSGRIRVKNKVAYTWYNRMPSRLTVAKISLLIDELSPIEQEVDRVLKIFRIAEDTNGKR